jgi:hypothetical protein
MMTPQRSSISANVPMNVARRFPLPIPKACIQRSSAGRAWLAANSGAVLHLEAGILEPVPIGGTYVRHWWVSIGHVPVQFHSENVRMWLPQMVDVYKQFDEFRIIIYHTFADFMLFSVRTKQEIKSLAEPD